MSAQATYQHLLDRIPPPLKPEIAISLASCSRAAGADAIYAQTVESLKRNKLQAHIRPVGCNGACFLEPWITIALPDTPPILYGPLTPAQIDTLLPDVLKHGNLHPELAVGVIADHSHDGIPPLTDHPFFNGQIRLVLRRCGQIDPRSLDDALRHGAYAGLAHALTHLSPEEIIAEVRRSGLRGRGGAGFPTGLKWEQCRYAPGSPKYILANGEGGDPGAYMDRALMESDPHAILEGMAIAAFAIGASQGYLFIRSEYPQAIALMQRAIEQAYAAGLLGEHILDTPFTFHVEIRQGPGAYVTGESTALQFVIEGRQGTPRWRPPHSTIAGLWGKPTTLNNVRTLSNIPIIVTQGGTWYAEIGTERSRGTKVFALTGKIKRRGLAEFPMGVPLRQLIFTTGGGLRDDRPLKAIQTGGPLGGCLPPTQIDMPVDFDSLREAGSIMGSGGILAVDDTTCLVTLSLSLLRFSSDESCGRCSVCRIGTRRMVEILTRITQRRGEPTDLDRIEELSSLMQKTALCGLGRGAPNIVLSTLRHFREEYDAHILEHRCPAGVCPMAP